MKSFTLALFLGEASTIRLKEKPGPPSPYWGDGNGSGGNKVDAYHHIENDTKGMPNHSEEFDNKSR